MTHQFIFTSIECEDMSQAPFDECERVFTRSEIGRKLARYIDEVRVFLTSDRHMEVRVRISRWLSDEDKMLVWMTYGGTQPSQEVQRFYGAAAFRT